MSILDIIINVFLSIGAFGFISVIVALMIGAPGREKYEIPATIGYLGTVALALYIIWT